MAEALTRLLSGGRCSFAEVGDGAIRIKLGPLALPKALEGVTHDVPRRSAPQPSQTAPPPPSLAEIVVTASRRPFLASRAPFAISALSGAQLSRSGGHDALSIASQIAGLTVTNLGAGRDKILLRGQSDGTFTGATQSTVPIYLDDLPVTYNAPDPDLRLVDVDRVEVLRGPQGSLYGAGSIGGLFRIVTRKPDLDAVSGTFSATGSSTGAGSFGSEVEGVLNLPLVPGRLAVRLVGYDEREDGWISDVRLGLRNVNASARSGGRVAVRLGLTPDWTLDVGLTHQSINLSDTQYANAAVGDLKRANFAREPHDNDFDQAYATLDGQGEWGRMRGSAAVLRHRLDTTYDASLALPRFITSPVEPAAFDEARRIDLLVGDLAMSSPERGRFHWLLGAFGAAGTEADRLALSVVRGGAAPYQETRTDDREEVAVYGEATYRLVGPISLTAGFRVSHSTLTTDSLVQQPDVGPGARAYTGHRATTGVTPKVVISYQPRDTLVFYVQASQGYRPSGFNTSGPIGQVFPSPSGVVEPQRSFTADSLWNYEAGAKLRSSDSRLSLRTAVYYATWDSLQTDQFLPSGLPYTVNVGDGVITGAEIEAAWQVTDHLRLQGAGLLDDPQLTNERNTGFPSRADAGLPGVPNVSFSATVDYRRPLTRNSDIFANAQYSYVGSSNVTFDPQTLAHMGEYNTFRFRLGLQHQRWSLTAFVDNLLNDRNNTFAFGNPFSFLQTQQVTPQKPRTVGLSLSAEF